MPRKSTKVEYACLQCGAPSLALPSRRAYGLARYCSKSCGVRSHGRRPEDIWRYGARTESGCLVWTGAASRAGYGQMRLDDHTQYVHRIAWTLINGPIPDGLHILHHCDNPPCFEPSHLFAGTHSDNMADMHAKGRDKNQWHPDHVRSDRIFTPPAGWNLRGQDCPNTNLTNDMVRDIRRRYDEGGVRQVDLAAEYNVTQSTISLIILRKHWQHIV